MQANEVTRTLVGEVRCSPAIVDTQAMIPSRTARPWTSDRPSHRSGGGPVPVPRGDRPLPRSGAAVRRATDDQGLCLGIVRQRDATAAVQLWCNSIN